MENEQDIESKRADSGADWMRLVKPLESGLDDDCGFPLLIASRIACMPFLSR